VQQAAGEVDLGGLGGEFGRDFVEPSFFDGACRQCVQLGGAVVDETVDQSEIVVMFMVRAPVSDGRPPPQARYSPPSFKSEVQQ